MKKIIVFLFILFSINLFAAYKVEVIEVNTQQFPKVKVVFRILDENNNPITGLSGKDLGLLFNQKPIKLGLKEDTQLKNISAVILIDASGSLRKNKRKQIKKAAQAFIIKMRGGDEAAVFQFHDYLKKLIGFTENKKKLVNAVARLKKGGRYTRMYNAITKISNYLHKNGKNSKKIMLIIGDGHDEKSTKSIGAAIKSAQKYKIPVYSMGYSNINPKYFESLKRISRETGGLFSQEGAVDLASKILTIEKSTYEIMFKLFGIGKNNKLALLIKSQNLNVDIPIDLSAFYKKEIPAESKLIYIIIAGILFILLIFIFLIIKVKKGKKKSLFNEDEKKKFSYLVLFTLENIKDKKTLKIFKSITSSASISASMLKNFINELHLVKEKLKENELINEDDFNSILSKLKKLLEEDQPVSLKRYLVNPYLAQIINLIAQLQGTKGDIKEIQAKSEEVKKFVLKFEEETKIFKEDLIDDILFDESNMVLDSFLDQYLAKIFFTGIGEFDIEKIIKEIQGLEVEDIYRVVPFMIQVVKDAEGFEKNAGLNILKNLALNMNINPDDLEGVNDWENWWIKQKEQILEKIKKEPIVQKEKEEASLGLHIHDELVLYAFHNNKLSDIKARIVGLHNDYLVFIINEPYLLEQVFCLYSGKDDIESDILIVHDYMVLRLIEVEEIEESVFEVKLEYLKQSESEEKLIESLEKIMEEDYNE